MTTGVPPRATGKGGRVALSRVENASARRASGMLSSGGEVIFMAVTLHGPRIAREALERGLRAAQRVHRVLQTSLGRDADGTFFLVEDERVRVPVIERPRCGSDGAWRDVFAEEIEPVPMQFNVQAASPHALYLFADADSDVHQVVFKLAHFICDGPSVINLIHLVLHESLAVPMDTPLPSPSPWTVDCDSALFHTLKSAPWLQTALGLVRAALNPALVFLHPGGARTLPTMPLQGSYADFARTSRTVAHCAQLSAAETAGLTAACKARGASVTAVVLAAALKASAQAMPDACGGALSGCVVANTRKACGMPDSVLSNGASGYFVRALPTASVFDSAEGIKRTIVANQDDMPYYGLLSVLGQGLIATTFAAPEPTLCISSWCPKSPLAASYSNWRVHDVELLQNTRHVCYPLLSVYTVCDRLHLSFFVQTPRFDAVLARDVLLRCAQLLRDCGSAPAARL